jgi:hypothetical protein
MSEFDYIVFESNDEWLVNRLVLVQGVSRILDQHDQMETIGRFETEAEAREFAANQGKTNDEKEGR